MATWSSAVPFPWSKGRPRGPPLVSHPGLPGLSDHLGDRAPGMVRCDGLAPSNVVDHLAQERQVDLCDASVTSLKVRF